MKAFSGWKLPLEFSSAREEHLNVRKACGVFDVSHMGEIQVQGERALDFLSFILTNKADKIKEGECQYTLMCAENGGILDDMILYCLKKPSDYLLCVNAANTEKIFKWMNQKNDTGVLIKDVSCDWGQVAVQGPSSPVVMKKVFEPFDFSQIKRFCFKSFMFCGKSLMVSRTGYTGEDGFEILSPWESTAPLWEILLEKGGLPSGLLARDTLRLEMKYPLYGQDMNEETLPQEMGLLWACKNPSSFIGKNFIHTLSEYQWTAFEMLEKSGVPRPGSLIFSLEGRLIGKVTSGAFSPSLNKMIGLSRVKTKALNKEACFRVEIHSQKLKAQKVSAPFVKL